MIVFKYFFKKMDEFGPLMDEREHKEQQEAAEQEAAEQGPYDFMEEEEGEIVEEVSPFTLKLVKHAHTSYAK